MAPETIHTVVVQYFAAIGHMDPDEWVACFASA